MSATLAADRARCIGAGQCVRVAPALFDQDERDGLVVVKFARPVGAALDRARQAERLCPARAVRVTEDSLDNQGDKP